MAKNIVYRPFFITIETMKKVKWGKEHEEYLDKKYSNYISRMIHKPIASSEEEKEIKDNIILTNPYLSEILSVAMSVNTFKGQSDPFVYHQVRDLHVRRSSTPLLHKDSTHPDEHDLLNHVMDTLIHSAKAVLKSTEETIYVTYNGLSFTAWYLFYKMMKYGIDDNESGVNIGLFDFTRYQKRPHFDLMMWLCNWDVYKALPLQNVAIDMNIPGSKDCSTKRSLREFYNKDDYKYIINYHKSNLRILISLFNKVKRFYL